MGSAPALVHESDDANRSMMRLDWEHTATHGGLSTDHDMHDLQYVILYTAEKTIPHLPPTLIDRAFFRKGREVTVKVTAR